MKSIPTLLLCLAAACASAPKSLYELYVVTIEDMEGEGGVSEATDERNAKRYADVRGRIARGEVVTGEDHLYAAGILSTSDSVDDLEAAQGLAKRAVELGEERGRVFVAETTDKLLVRQGRPQRFGTQIFLDVGTGKWALYPCDSSVTDETREYMGLPTLMEMRQRIAQLNSQRDVAGSILEAATE